MTDRLNLAAATFAAISAALHLAALPAGGFATAAGPAILGTAVWALLATVLFRGGRAGAWAGFLLAMAGAVGALWIAMGAEAGLPRLVWGAVLVADFAVGVVLFRLLWRDPA